MIVRISTDCIPAGEVIISLLFQPNGLQMNALFRWAGARGLRFGAEDEVCWIGDRMGMGNSTSVVEGTRPGAKSGQGDFFSPSSLSPPLSSPQHPSSVARPPQHCGGWTPPLHYSTTPFPKRFPATFPAVFLCMGWRPVASPRKRRSGKK